MFLVATLPILITICLACSGLIGFLGAKDLTSCAERAVKGMSIVTLILAVAAAVAFAITDETRLDWAGTGFGSQLDLVSVTMLNLVAFLAWVILTYALSYLRGEARRGEFIGHMGLTLASVSALVQSTNLVQLALFWIFTSLLLHKLLLFYAERPAAKRAQRKKFVIARIGDIAMITGIFLTYRHFGSLDITEIVQTIRAGHVEGGTGWIVGLFAIAAIMKSAQFPTHGWIIEVMETPTPVSALLHAGIVNAGGFLLIRLSDLVVTSPTVMTVLALIGLFTAVFGSAVMITQPAVKTRLAWSTISQMGFMILQCGLGLFALALLHLVAHSLYKAYAFLSSGGTIEKIRGLRKAGPRENIRPGLLIGSFVLGIAIWAATGALFGETMTSPAVMALSVVVIFAANQLLSAVLSESTISQRMIIGLVTSLGISVCYFGVHALTSHIGIPYFPSWTGSMVTLWVLSLMVIANFVSLGLFQSYLLSGRQPADWLAGFYVHLANGFYLNAVIDRYAGTWRITGNGTKLSGEKS